LSVPFSEHDVAGQNRWRTEPSLREVALILLVSGVLFALTIKLFRPFLATAYYYGDNNSFMQIASAIRRWNFQGLIFKAFWGLPYALAGLGFLTGLSNQAALLVVSYLAGLATVLLAHKLWGGWVAGFFAVLSLDWLQRLVFGGAESLFLALAYGSFLAARQERWILAALLAAFAMIVRPFGIFALVGIGLALLAKRDYRNLIGAMIAGSVIGGLYMLPFALYFHSPLAAVHAYQKQDWEGGSLLGWPLFAIVKGTFLDRPPLTNLLLTWGWILLVLAGALALVLTERCRELWRTRFPEMFFAVCYLVFIYTYNSPRWGTFPRLAIPILPFVLFALRQWIPKDRRLLWSIAVVSPILAACSALGIRNVVEIVRQRIG